MEGNESAGDKGGENVEDEEIQRDEGSRLNQIESKGVPLADLQLRPEAIESVFHRAVAIERLLKRVEGRLIAYGDAL